MVMEGWLVVEDCLSSDAIGPATSYIPLIITPDISFRFQLSSNHFHKYCPFIIRDIEIPQHSNILVFKFTHFSIFIFSYKNLLVLIFRRPLFI